MPNNTITRKKRCVSGCKSLEQTICSKSPRCSYTNGATRKFCRLKSGFKMRKTDCKVTKRIKKADAKKKIAKFILERRKSKTEKTLTSPFSKVDEKTSSLDKASRTIFKFFKNTGEKRTTEYLKAICSDSGVCIAFGKNRNKIINFFDGFNNFQYVAPPIRSIGTASINGFVKEVRYKKNGYEAYAVLKSSAASTSDNLAYEYLAGQFLNQQCSYYPCFVETYGLYYYKDYQKWKHIKETKEITTNVLKDSLTPYSFTNSKEDYIKMCESSKFSAIMIQHLKNASTLKETLENKSPKTKSFIRDDLISVLYQVYMPLSQLKDRFTHYDLHSDNVLLYEPVKGKHIRYHYHNTDGSTVTFCSPYIAKIIDYGRCFFKYKRDEKSSKTILDPKEIYEKLCEEPKCNEDSVCGSTSGLNWLRQPYTNKSHFISSQMANVSHDLRLLSYIKDNDKPRIKTLDKDPETQIMFETITKGFLDKVTYGEGITGKNKQFGTKPNTKSGYPDKINNVEDAERVLRKIIADQYQDQNQNQYKDQDCLGDLHVYTDGRPIRFEPTNS